MENDIITNEEQLAFWQVKTEEIYQQWKDHKLLQDVPLFIARKLSLLLENLKWHKNDGTEDFPQHLAPVVVDIYKNSPIFNMIYVEPMVSPNMNVYYYVRNYWGFEEVNYSVNSQVATAKTRKLKTQVYVDRGDSIFKNAAELRSEIIREVAVDLKNNAGTVATSQTEERLDLQIEQVFNCISRKTERTKDKWIYTNDIIAKMLLGRDFHDLKEPTDVGFYNNDYRVIVDCLWSKSILCGVHDPEKNQEGYYYMPYLALVEAPNILGDDYMFCNRRGYLSRYAKLFTPNSGPKSYGVIKYEVQ